MIQRRIRLQRDPVMWYFAVWQVTFFKLLKQANQPQPRMSLVGAMLRGGAALLLSRPELNKEPFTVRCHVRHIGHVTTWRSTSKFCCHVVQYISTKRSTVSAHFQSPTADEILYLCHWVVLHKPGRVSCNLTRSQCHADCDNTHPMKQGACTTELAQRHALYLRKSPYHDVAA